MRRNSNASHLQSGSKLRKNLGGPRPVFTSQKLIEDMEVPVASLVCGDAGGFQQICSQTPTPKKASAVKVEKRESTDSAAVVIPSCGSVSEGFKNSIARNDPFL